MAANRAQFYAISFKNRSFETIFIKNNLEVFASPLSKPYPTSVIAFSETIMDQVLEAIGLTRDDISGYEDTERENLKLIRFSRQYEFSVTYGSPAIAQTMSDYNDILIDILRENPGLDISIISPGAPGEAYERADGGQEKLSIVVPVLSASTAVPLAIAEGLHIYDLSATLIPEYLAKEAVIRADFPAGNFPAACFKPLEEMEW